MKVTVCMITYNHERFIKRATQSVLEQDVNFEYEIVVGEDCSTDKTASILRELERENPNRIRVIYRPANIGSNANFLNTLSACYGEYVAFLEGDDFWTSSDKLQCQVNFLDNNRGAAGVFHRTRVGTIGENDALIGEHVLPGVDPPELFSLDFLSNQNQFSVSSLLARRAYLRNVDAWLAGVKPGDWPLFMMLATQGDLGFIPLEMSYHPRHPAGNWYPLSLQHKVAMLIRVLMHVTGLVSGKDRELIEFAKSSYANAWSSELVANTSVSIEALTNELDQIADFRLSNYLLARVAAVARAKSEAPQSQEDHAKACEASAASASQDASEALTVNQRLLSTLDEQRDRIAELQSENAYFRTLVNQCERDARRTRWLLDRLGEKVRHVPRDLSRGVRASVKKRRQLNKH